MRNDRKVIVIISDGMDDADTKAPGTVVFARKQNGALYTILVPSGAQLYVGPSSRGVELGAFLCSVGSGTIC